jgi:hypothetical protein
MNYGQRWIGMVLLTQGALGCAAGGSDASNQVASADAELVSVELAKLGFRTEGLHLEIDDDLDLVRIDGDQLFHKSALLDGRYAQKPEVNAGLVQKGYVGSAATLVSSANVRNIKLAFDNVPSELEDYAPISGYDWGGTSSVNVSTTNTGPTMTVHGLDDSTWPGPCKPTELACTFFPVDGNPGDIYFHLNINAGGCNWDPVLAQAVMTHEMGHAIGFAHPEDAASSAHINGTADVNDPSFYNSYYPTIMHAYVEDGASYEQDVCMGLSDELQGDDRNSVSIIYPK